MPSTRSGVAGLRMMTFMRRFSLEEIRGGCNVSDGLRGMQLRDSR
jgi:hypothetical protein